MTFFLRGIASLYCCVSFDVSMAQITKLSLGHNISSNLLGYLTRNLVMLLVHTRTLKFSGFSSPLCFMQMWVGGSVETQLSYATGAQIAGRGTSSLLLSDLITRVQGYCFVLERLHPTEKNSQQICSILYIWGPRAAGCAGDFSTPLQCIKDSSVQGHNLLCNMRMLQMLSLAPSTTIIIRNWKR